MIDLNSEKAVSPLILIGGSTRAAAFSAVRAGFSPICCDRYNDLDTTRVAKAFPVKSYPEDLISLTAHIPSAPLVYVGALENWPDLIDSLAERHEVWGMTGENLRKSRDPASLHEVQRFSRAPILEARTANDPPPADGTWIRRPLKGSGGQGISVWDEAAAGMKLTEDCIFQKKVDGMSCSAVFLAAAEQGDVQFVGVTQQLIGQPEFGVSGFVWCGNIGPIALPIEVEHLIRRIGNVLKWKCGMRGMFGVDFILDAQNQVWVTEVNPRYPASAELLEWSTHQPLLWMHANCFADPGHPLPRWKGPNLAHFLGKAVVYATEAMTVGSAAQSLAANVDPWKFPVAADIPVPGTALQPGEPILTVFAQSDTADGCRELLVHQAAELTVRLRG